MTKILITGVNGFIGQSLFRRLIETDADVVGGKRTSDGDSRVIVTPDLDGEADWTRALSGVDVIVHTAGRAHVLKEGSDKGLEIFRKVNTLGAIKLAEDAVRSKVKRFVFISSIGVHGPCKQHPFKETDPPNPVEDYAISKIEAEQGLIRLGRSSGMEIVIIRPTLVYGPHAPGNFGLLAKVINRRLPLPFGSIKFNRRSFVGIDNLISLIVCIIYNPNAANEIFIAADNESISTAEFIDVIGLAYGIRPINLNIPYAWLKYLASIVGKTNLLDKVAMSLEASNQKAKTLLGWSPPYTLLEGLKRTSQPIATASKHDKSSK